MTSRKVGSHSMSLFTPFVLTRIGSTVAINGLALVAVADFGAQNCQYTTKVDAR